MKKEVLRGKIHRATVTEARPDYEGSIGIDSSLLRAADIEEYDRVEVYDVTRGSRFATYAIEAPEGSGTVSVNGAAARLVSPGDLVIIAAYGTVEVGEPKPAPRLVFVDARNRVAQLKEREAERAAEGSRAQDGLRRARVGTEERPVAWFELEDPVVSVPGHPEPPVRSNREVL